MIKREHEYPERVVIINIQKVKTPQIIEPAGPEI
jgi:hypothetical protein